MKVLMILTSNFGYNGITSTVLRYYQYMKKENIKIDFVVMNEAPQYVKKIIDKDSKINVIPRKIRQGKPIKYIKLLTKIIKEEKYDIIHVHGSSAIISLELYAAKKAGCKNRIVHSHNTTTDHILIHKMLYPYFRKNYTYALACGEEAGKWLFRNKKFEILPNGQEISKYEFNQLLRDKIRKEYNVEDKIVIGHVGGFNYQKNHEYLIDIFKKLNEKDKEKYLLMLVGDGELRNSIVNKIEEFHLKDKVLILGKISNVEEILQAMDIMVFPSRFEGLPNVVLEWQIAGLPCLISDKVTQEVKVTNLVKFIELDDIDKWVDAIENVEIYDRNANKDYIIKQIREAEFDIVENAKKLEKIYNEIFEGKK